MTGQTDDIAPARARKREGAQDAAPPLLSAEDAREAALAEWSGYGTYAECVTFRAGWNEYKAGCWTLGELSPAYRAGRRAARAYARKHAGEAVYGS